MGTFYHASKAVLNMLMVHMLMVQYRNELKDKGVKMHSADPGRMRRI
jgi:NADP-dependent 3-hydroxy acid dehydrogenase YdfG